MNKPKIVDPKVISILEPGEELVIKTRSEDIIVKCVHKNMYIVRRVQVNEKDREILVIDRDLAEKIIHDLNRMGLIQRSFIRLS